ncbi:MAG: hypothetical protein M3Q27_09150, partial [Actinomycetota bacterium]|nr:hypothetical protein [Actinomycetota bacterium]
MPRRRARRRLLPALLTTGTGTLALATAVAPDASATLVLPTASPDAEQLLMGGVVLAQIGVVLLLAGRLLARGSHA